MDEESPGRAATFSHISPDMYRLMNEGSDDDISDCDDVDATNGYDAKAGGPRIPSALGHPFQRTEHGPTTEEAKQRHEVAAQKIMLLASQYKEKLKQQEDKNLQIGERNHKSGASRPRSLPKEMKFSSEDLDALREEVAGTIQGDGAAGVKDLEDPQHTLIIFDWDDTLFPTWFLLEVLLACIPQGCQASQFIETSEWFEVLSAHAQAIRQVLSCAKAMGQVAIVTLSKRPWVDSSGRYLPGLDITALLKELEIPVVYARECLKRHRLSMAQEEEGVDVCVAMKCSAMDKLLTHIYGKRPWKNIISIGDSLVERDAVKDVIWNWAQKVGVDACCKTAKLMNEPSVEQLTAELLLVSSWLQKMVRHEEDFDIDMDHSDETMLMMHEQFV